MFGLWAGKCQPQCAQGAKHLQNTVDMPENISYESQASFIGVLPHGLAWIYSSCCMVRCRDLEARPCPQRCVWWLNGWMFNFKLSVEEILSQREASEC